MSRLQWDTAGQRYYETGVDQGVLYIDSVGVAWPGLISVAESNDGAGATPFYQDGVKYLNIMSHGDFACQIDAFSAPFEFNACDGTVAVNTGLFASNQPRKQFGFSYRTLIGNDLLGNDHGYKLHLVYNALASAASRTNSTISDSVSPLILSWEVSTVPEHMPGLRPTSHYIIDSRYTDPEILIELEEIMYGKLGVIARQPTVLEVADLFS